MKNCDHCSYDIPPSASECPHCGLPSIFPNISLAEEEQPEMNRLYLEALANALSRGAEDGIGKFEIALVDSCAIINRPTSELLRLADDQFAVYPTYYHLSEGIRLQKGEEFDSLRQAADSIFFTGFQKNIRFAALSLDTTGLGNYGDSSWVLRDDMIAHRASLFVENTTLFYMHNDIKGAKDAPKGYRVIWSDRAKLCVIKLGPRINSSTTAGDYPGVLLKQGTTSKDDEIVEVHIFGPMTIRTIKEVTFRPIPTTISKSDQRFRHAQRAAIKEKLAVYGVTVS